MNDPFKISLSFLCITSLFLSSISYSQTALSDLYPTDQSTEQSSDKSAQDVSENNTATEPPTSPSTENSLPLTEEAADTLKEMLHQGATYPDIIRELAKPELLGADLPPKERGRINEGILEELYNYDGYSELYDLLNSANTIPFLMESVELPYTEGEKQSALNEQLDSKTWLAEIEVESELLEDAYKKLAKIVGQEPSTYIANQEKNNYAVQRLLTQIQEGEKKHDLRTLNRNRRIRLLTSALDHPNAELMTYLHSLGVSPDIRGRNGEPLIVKLVREGRSIENLVAAGANLDARDADGFSALYYANDPSTFKLLLENGASTQLKGGKNKKGKRARSILKVLQSRWKNSEVPEEKRNIEAMIDLAVEQMVLENEIDISSVDSLAALFSYIYRNPAKSFCDPNSSTSNLVMQIIEKLSIDIAGKYDNKKTWVKDWRSTRLGKVQNEFFNILHGLSAHVILQCGGDAEDFQSFQQAIQEAVNESSPEDSAFSRALQEQLRRNVESSLADFIELPIESDASARLNNSEKSSGNSTQH